MRLIDVDEFCNNKQLKLEYFVGDKIPRYAILSHTWGDGEVTFHDVDQPDTLTTLAGYGKIEGACRQAAKDHYRYLWVDTCCINKESSSELSEAINSMYQWYEDAEVCYVYLDDLPSNCPRLREKVSDVCHAYTGVEFVGPVSSDPAMKRRSLLGDVDASEREIEPLTTPQQSTPQYWVEALSKCRWFTRGWTLQELIAPLNVAFFGQKWNPIAYKQHLLHTISGITGVDTLVLTHQISLEELSAAKKLSWAAGRKTTREEDQSYCLLGILGINMTLLYGEGSKAFTRLQEEVLRISTDCSIFLWSRGRNVRQDSRRSTRALKQRPDENRKLLAPSITVFKPCGKVTHEKRSDYACSYSMTHRGLQLEIVLMPLPSDDFSYEEYLGIMPCHLEDDFQHSLAIHLRKHATGPHREALYSIERCRPECSEMLPSAVSPSDMLHFHPVRTTDRPVQQYTSILIPRDNFQDTTNLSALEWTASVWVRTVPADVHFRQAYPRHQWNAHTLTWDRHKSLARESASRAGGMAFNYRGTDILIAFEVYLDTGVILALLRDDGYELPHVSEHVSELCSATNQPESRVTFSTATGPDEEMEVVARLSHSTVMDEKVWIIDLELRRTEFNMYLT